MLIMLAERARAFTLDKPTSFGRSSHMFSLIYAEANR